MERRFELRKEEMLSDCVVSPAALRDMRARLTTFAQPFIANLCHTEQREHAKTYLEGLVSDVERKNAESIAYRHDEHRLGLQKFLGMVLWEHWPLLDELARQIGRELGEDDGVLVFDPSAFPKKGTHSVGVQRQWCGRLGKMENCQVGVFMGYVAHQEHVLVDARLYLPEEWAKDRKRCRACGVPKDQMRFRTRHELCLEMLDAHGSRLPHAWITGDDEMGRPAHFRRELAERNELYLLAVPSNTTVRDLAATPPPYAGRGQPPKVPFRQVRRFCEALPADAWTRREVRDGEKGPIVVDIVACRVVAKIDRKVGPEETLVVVRSIAEDGAVKHDYYLSNAPADTPLAEFARVANAEHRVEECIKRGKSEAGLADYQVRNWLGWHHHITLSLVAAWFLVVETRRGKKGDPCFDGSPSPPRIGADSPPGLGVRHPGPHRPRIHPSPPTQRACSVLSQ
jgi:SRSO17 transposase